MRLEWTDERCILCTLAPAERNARCSETAELTKEHLIPTAVGGRLTCDFLCKHCNSILGQIEALLKENSSVHLAISNLRAQLPDLWATMAENQPCIAVGPGERIEGRIKKGTFSVDSSHRPDGSLIQPLTTTAKTVHTMLRRRSATQEEISNAEMKVKELPEGVRVKVANGIEVVKSTPTTVYPALNSQGIEPRILLKIAYEYLALHLGSKIFHQYFDPVRSTFLRGGVVPNCCSVQERRVRDRKYEPFHGLAFKNTVSGLVVKIRLFGYLSYPVHFFGLQIVPAKSHCYTLHLDSKQEECGQFEPA
jgi:HNH endonuclease